MAMITSNSQQAVLKEIVRIVTSFHVQVSPLWIKRGKANKLHLKQ